MFIMLILFHTLRSLPSFCRAREFMLFVCVYATLKKWRTFRPVSSHSFMFRLLFLLYSLLCVWYVFEYTLLFCVTIDVFSRFCRCKQTHQHTNTANERVCVCVFGTLNALLRDSIDTAHSTQLWQHTLALFLFWPIAAHSCRSIIIILAMFRYAILIIDGFSVEPMQLAHISGVSTNDQRNGKWYCESLLIIVNAQYPDKKRLRCFWWVSAEFIWVLSKNRVALSV